MKNRGTIVLLIERAESEIKAHNEAIKKNSYWNSGHKNKAKRAILTARELLLEASKQLDKEERQ